jgi:hypothetical protein
VETSMPESLYRFFEEYCRRYNITVAQALCLLVEIERDLIRGIEE